MFSRSPIMSQISLQKFFWNFFFFFKFFAQMEMMQNENSLFGRHFKTVYFFIYLFYFILF